MRLVCDVIGEFSVAITTRGVKKQQRHFRSAAKRTRIDLDYVRDYRAVRYGRDNRSWYTRTWLTRARRSGRGGRMTVRLCVGNVVWSLRCLIGIFTSRRFLRHACVFVCDPTRSSDTGSVWSKVRTTENNDVSSCVVNTGRECRSNETIPSRALIITPVPRVHATQLYPPNFMSCYDVVFNTLRFRNASVTWSVGDENINPNRILWPGRHRRHVTKWKWLISSENVLLPRIFIARFGRRRNNVLDFLRPADYSGRRICPKLMVSRRPEMKPKRRRFTTPPKHGIVIGRKNPRPFHEVNSILTVSRKAHGHATCRSPCPPHSASS